MEININQCLKKNFIVNKIVVFIPDKYNESKHCNIILAHWLFND